MSHNTVVKTSAYSILVISLCALFLFYKYVLQIYPSTITEQLMTEFQLTGAGLGNLAATFYYSYMIAQLFVGVILDKYSTRWLTAAAILVCALSTIWFSNSATLVNAQLSRALMGVGVAFATVAYMKVAASWFSPRQYPLVSGLLATAAMAGAVFGQGPLSFGISTFGWRSCLYGIGVAGIVLAILFVLFVRDKVTTHHHDSHLTFKDVCTVFKDKQNWLLTLYSGLAFTPIAVFGGLWGNPFLQQAYNLSKTEAASMVSIVFIGLAIGSPLLGFFSDRVGNRRHFMFYCTMLSCISISLILYWHTMPTTLLLILLFTFGFALGAFMIVFAMGKELNSPRLTATIIAMINASDGILTAITEPGIGKLLDLSWDGTLVNGVHYFSLNSYYIGLSVLPIFLFVAAMLLLWVKDVERKDLINHPNL